VTGDTTVAFIVSGSTGNEDVIIFDKQLQVSASVYGINYDDVLAAAAGSV